MQYIIISDTYIQKAKKSYTDNRARRNLNQINTELQDVQRIMVQNIDDVLQRGEALSGKSGVPSDKSCESHLTRSTFSHHFVRVESPI